MSAEVIQANFEALTGLAGRFSQQSDISAQTLQAVTQAVNRLQNGGWIGQGAEAFFAEMNGEVLPGLRRLVDAMAQAGQTTTQINRTMQTADEEASSGFKNDLTGGTAESSASSSAAPASGSSLGNSPDWGIPRDWLAGVTDSLNSLWQNSSLSVPPDWLAGVLAALTGSTAETAATSTAEAETEDSQPAQTTGEAAGGSQPGGSGGGSGSSGGSGGAEQASGQSGGGSSPTTTPASRPDRPDLGAAFPQAEITSPYSRGGGSWAGQAGGSGPASLDDSPAGGGLRYQPLGGMTGSGGGSGPRLVRPVGFALSGPEAAANPDQINLMPLGMAVASPFIALLGKAMKDNKEGK